MSCLARMVACCRIFMDVDSLCDACVVQGGRLAVTGEKHSLDVALRNVGKSHARQVNDKRESSAFTGEDLCFISVAGVHTSLSLWLHE